MFVDNVNYYDVKQMNNSLRERRYIDAASILPEKLL